MHTDTRQNRLLVVARLLETHLAYPWRLGELAARACYSPHHFEKVFAELTGLTPMDYLRRRRLLQAALRVRHERASLRQLAHDCGFASDSVFSRNFRQMFGFAPRDWREGAWGDYLLDNRARWQRLHACDVAAGQQPVAVALMPDVATTAAVRYCSSQPIWLSRRFGLWGYRAEQHVRALEAGLAMAAQELVWCAITREDPGFITGDEWLHDRAVLASSIAPAGWINDALPGGFYLCLRYRGSGAQLRWLYSDWLELQHYWVADASRPHLDVYRGQGAYREGELRLPVRPR